MDHFRALLDRTADLEIKSQIILALGQTGEEAGNFEMAVGFYQHALAMEPTDPFTDYFIYNSLGYSPVQLNRFAEAEERCRQAIAIDPNRSKWRKNLGLALQVRGGSCWNRARGCRSTYRDGGDPGDRDGDLGFRLAAGLAGAGSGAPGPEAGGADAPVPEAPAYRTERGA